MTPLALSLILAQPMTPKTLFDFTMPDIDGKPVKLSKFKGKTLLVVNTASKCGLTPQYEGLQALYEKYKSQGFVILGFPCNDFRGQEPGANAEIKQFCTEKYDVTFPMFSKIKVLGEDRAPLYRFLVEQSDRPLEPVEWNFAKFLIDRDGAVVARFAPKVSPTDEGLVKKIELMLGN